MEAKPKANRFSPEVWACAERVAQVRLGDQPSEWTGICPISLKIGRDTEMFLN